MNKHHFYIAESINRSPSYFYIFRTEGLFTAGNDSHYLCKVTKGWEEWVKIRSEPERYRFKNRREALQVFRHVEGKSKLEERP